MDPETNDWVCSFFTKKPQGKYLWLNFFVFGTTHLFSIYGAYLLWTKASIFTWISCFIFYHVNMLGTTVCAHRYYAHRAFKANLPLRIILMLMQSSAYQRDIVHWAIWHRIHHKYTDTDADPHSIKRGFFFAHMGWLLMRPTKDFEEKKKLINVDDLLKDPIIRFQVKYYPFVAVMAASFVPALIAVLGWGEEPMTALSTSFFRWTLSLHASWLVNSLAHVHGMKPYNYEISAAGNLFHQISTCGEGHHNYHHAFPYDYRGHEHGVFYQESTKFIEFFAWLGWARNLRSASAEKIEEKKRENLRNMQENAAKG